MNLKSRMLFTVVSILSLMIVAGCNDGEANMDAYPERSINAIVPWGAGSGSDIAFRGYADAVSQELDQDINVQNITGANGATGWTEASAATNDGYNVSLLTVDILTNEALGTSNTSYRDFEIINLFTLQGMLLVTNSDYEWDNMDEFFEAAKEAKEAGQPLTIATNGNYGVWHQAGIVMEQGTETEGLFDYVPFDGSSEQATELIGEHVDASIMTSTPVLDYLEEGSLLGLGLMADERDDQIPDVPTFLENEYDVQYESFRALAVPADTPEEILEVLREAGKDAFDSEDFQEWATTANIDQLYMNHEEAVEFLDNLYPTVENVVNDFD